MPPLTLNQAAREAGKSKATILEAIRGGRLSASKDEQGRYQIDPAELFRVYPANRSDRTEPTTQNHGQPLEANTETGFLKGRLEAMAELVEQIKNERDDLRRRLDHAEAAREREADEREKAAAELRRLTLLLTHAPEIDQAPAPEAHALPFARWPFWFALALATTAAAYWFPRS